MSKPPTPAPLLARLRRSTRVAVFMALVMVAKLAGGYACVGEGLATLGNEGAVQQAALFDDGSYPGAVLAAIDHADPQAAHVAGSCCHCSCHQTTALPGNESFVRVERRLTTLPTTSAVFVPTRLERELRPPIV